ncbi:hypothetical protein IM543_21065 [Massilia sp. UMI-21]|nr:hypothetical protein IM543_21065 [Massilia sp. UMI-21]
MNVRETPRAPARTVAWEFAQSTYASVLAEVPAALFTCWARSAHQEFPGIARDAAFYAQAAEGLMMFFDCAAAAGRPCALPSRAADSVWHAWTRMDAAGLERFCIRHFGRSIAHLERARMGEGEMGRALAVCLVQARRRASKPAAGPDLPRLFTLDARLGMPRGFGYGITGGLVTCSALDELGHPEGRPSFPNALTPHGLLRAGLIGEDDYARVRGPICSPTQAEWIGVGCDAAVDSGDGDSDGAVSCGSACGGGGCGAGCDS